MRIVGIDPGERWTGFAVLDLSMTAPWRAQAGVLDASEDLYRVTDRARYLSPPDSHVAIEEYHVRPAGHQQWTRAMTVRLIGSIEYALRESTAKTFFYPAGDASKDLGLLNISRSIMSWKREHWTPRKKQWSHALSAWRILGLHMLDHFPDALAILAKCDPTITRSPQDTRFIHDLWIVSEWSFDEIHRT